MAARKAVPTPEKTPLLPDEFDIGQMAENVSNFIVHEISLNSFSRYLAALGIAVVGITLIWLVKGFIARRATAWLSSSKTHGVDQQMAEETGSALVPLLYLFPLYFALDTLDFSAGMRRFISFFILVLFITRTVRFFSALASFATDAYLRNHQESLDSTVGRALSPIIRVVFWAIGITVLLDNMGFQISSLLAGLGIVGVAVGLAGQTILGDFFGYLVIIMDRPFSIGDSISFGGVTGTVESIGLKTTRVRLTGGEIMVCPNGDLTKQQLSNFRMMKERTRTFTVGVAYETPAAVLRAIPGMIEEIERGIAGVTVNRVHLVTLGDSSLNFEISITVRSRFLAEALTAQQELFLGILERFEQEKITIAYPTRTLYLAGDAAAAGQPFGPLRPMS